MQRRTKTAWLVVGVAALLAILAVIILPTMNLSGSIERTTALFREAGPLPFFLAMALLPVIGFPLSAFTVIAGPVFGPTMGVSQVVAATILATTTNVALSYWIASRALRPFFERLLRWLGYRLPEIRPHTAWPVILVVRIVPGPPFFLQSYLLALAKAPFSVYMIVSTLVPACYLSATIILGDALARGDHGAMGVAAALFVGAGTVLHFLRKRFTPPRQPGPHQRLDVGAPQIEDPCVAADEVAARPEARSEHFARSETQGAVKSSSPAGSPVR